MIGHKFFHEINNNQWIKASSSTSKLTGNYISGELVVPHYKNVFSGVFGSFFAKFTHGILTGKRYLLCLFSFLLAALSFCSYWNSNFVPLSVYLYLSHFYMSRVASTLVLLFLHHYHGCSSPTKSIGISAMIQFLPAADRECLHIQWFFHFLTNIFSPATITCCSSVAFRILWAMHHMIVRPDSILGLL